MSREKTPVVDENQNNYQETKNILEIGQIEFIFSVITAILMVMSQDETITAVAGGMHLALFTFAKEAMNLSRQETITKLDLLKTLGKISAPFIVSGSIPELRTDLSTYLASTALLSSVLRPSGTIARNLAREGANVALDGLDKALTGLKEGLDRIKTSISNKKDNVIKDAKSFKLQSPINFKLRSPIEKAAIVSPVRRRDQE